MSFCYLPMSNGPSRNRFWVFNIYVTYLMQFVSKSFLIRLFKNICQVWCHSINNLRWFVGSTFLAHVASKRSSSGELEKFWRKLLAIWGKSLHVQKCILQHSFFLISYTAYDSANILFPLLLFHCNINFLINFFQFEIFTDALGEVVAFFSST